MKTPTTGERPRVLIVGLGITGMACAIRLHRLGWQPVIIERASARRKGGYTLWLFGAGRATAGRLGILDAVTNRVHPDYHTYEINRANQRRKGFSFNDLPDSPRMVLRGDVESALFTALPPDVEIRFSTTPLEIKQDPEGVSVTLKDLQAGATDVERFALVVGADGIRSSVRRLVFGPHEEYLHPLNYMIATCILRQPVEGYANDEGFILAEARRSAWVFSYADHHPTVLFSYRTDDVSAELSCPPIESLRRAFGPQPTGSVLGQLLNQYEAADQALFDSVNLVKMDRWHRGRVVLAGDAAWCMTLYSGMGASVGMAGGELLGNMLETYPDNLELALGRWEERMRPFVEGLQRGALGLRVFFTPQSEVQRMVRAAVFYLITRPAVIRIIERLNKGKDLRAFDIVTHRLSART